VIPVKKIFLEKQEFLSGKTLEEIITVRIKLFFKLLPQPNWNY